MIELNIPGRGTIKLEHLVSDVNGTLAVDGQLHDGLPRILANISHLLSIHLLTADTHGRQKVIDNQLGLKAVRIPPGNEAGQKSSYVEQLGEGSVIAIGQGANDAGMLKTAAIGIGILSQEGLAAETVLAADIIVPDIYAALELVEKPLRIVATLRR